MAALRDTVVKVELDQMDKFPASDEERKVACRAIVRFKGRRDPGNTEDDASPIEVTEDWVRLYVALRRGSGSQSMRLSAGHLRRWRARVSSSTTVKRKVFIVKTAALLELPTYPEDLQRWVIPRGDLELPADIYGDDVVVPPLGASAVPPWRRPLEAQCARVAPLGGCPQMGPRALQRLHNRLVRRRPPQGWGR